MFSQPILEWWLLPPSLAQFSTAQYYCPCHSHMERRKEWAFWWADVKRCRYASCQVGRKRRFPYHCCSSRRGSCVVFLFTQSLVQGFVLALYWPPSLKARAQNPDSELTFRIPWRLTDSITTPKSHLVLFPTSTSQQCTPAPRVLLPRTQTQRSKRSGLSGISDCKSL